MPGTDISFHDEVKGDLMKKAADMKDFVIVRSDGSPVFHLANVLDDIFMGVTHVIRGDDHVENTFRHIALFRALEAPVPVYAHLPMIVNAQGKPYSKRDGAAYVGEFKERGFLPQALFNYLALLGWSPGDGRELLSLKEMVELFDFHRVQSSPAQFDVVKLTWLNGEHMRRLPEEDRMADHRADLRRHGLWKEGDDEDYVRRVISIMEDRIKLFSDTAAQTVYFFTEEFPWDDKAVRKRLLKPGAQEGLAALRERFARLEVFDAVALEAALKQVADSRGGQAGDLIHPARVAVSGCSAGPGLFIMLETLGRDRVLSRLDRALDKIRNMPGSPA
jgi:glutamyl-tRNA synthetase